MRTDLIIFDLDGTLLDSLEELAASVNAGLRGMGLPEHPRDAYRAFVGNGVRTLARRALPLARQDQGHVDRLVEALRQEYAERWRHSRPYAGVDTLLDLLAAQGLPAAVLSNKPDDFTRRIVAETLGAWSFAAVRGAGPDTPAKPDPAGALALARELGAAPERVVFVGDSDVDMQTAVAAGMVPAGALWGFRDRAELEANGARLLLERPQDLPALLDGRARAATLPFARP